MTANNETITFALEGQVPLREFGQAMERFSALIASLTNEIAADAGIQWVVEDLEAGSAVATIRGLCEKPERVAAVAMAYTQIGRSLRLRQPIPYSDRVRKPAMELLHILNDEVSTMRFETAYEDVLISDHHEEVTEADEPHYFYGAVKGTVQTLSRRHGVRFVLYDPLFDHPISCYLKEGQEDRIKNLWGRRVRVTGKVGRNPRTDRPFAIRDITNIELAEPSAPGSYRHARGVLVLEDNETSESVISRLRND